MTTQVRVTGFVPALLAAVGLTVAAASAVDRVVTLRAAPAEVAILPGPVTTVWRYTAEVVAGPSDTVEDLPGSFPGPILRVRTGDRLTVRITNGLPEETTVHWHGLDVPSVMDGHPSRPILPGETREVTFPILNRAGTYWFHPHPHMTTGSQVAMGLAGLVLVSDGPTDSFELPDGELDVPLVLQDRRFDAANRIVYVMSMAGYLGERILVNGKPDFTLSAATRAYRLRLLNGSNARIYKLAWDDGTPIVAIGSDGGLLDAPVSKPYLMLAPGERAEVWLDLSDRPVGTQLGLRSLAFSGVAGGYPALPNGAEFPVMQVTVDRAEKEFRTLPATFAPIDRFRLKDAANAAAPRTFALSMSAGQWRINGLVFDMLGTVPNEETETSTLEAWRFTNTSMMGLQAHPMHLHGPQFQVFSRSLQPAYAATFATVSQGLLDTGWKDTVLVMPGEQVTVLVRTSRYPGLFLYHCHNLEHEDMGMMRNYRLAKACPADVDDDGAVGAGDLATVLAEWGPRPGSLADIDGDGEVDAADLSATLAGWGGCPGGG
jgi:FtsP/CotA-like multicopper oxidase with cupredoxin domain